MPDAKPLQDSGHVHQKPSLLQQAWVVEVPSSSTPIKFMPQTVSCVKNKLDQIHKIIINKPPCCKRDENYKSYSIRCGITKSYGNEIPAVIARTGYDSNSQTKTMAVVVKQSDVAIHIQDVVVLQNLREMEFWPLLPKQIKITIPDQNHGRCCKIYKHCNSYSSMEFIALPSTSKDSSMENSTGSSSIVTPSAISTIFNGSSTEASTGSSSIEFPSSVADNQSSSSDSYQSIHSLETSPKLEDISNKSFLIDPLVVRSWILQMSL